MRHWGEPLNVRTGKTQAYGNRVLERILNVTNALILVWICVIWWGERLAFSRSVAACQWHQWEQWVSDILAVMSTLC
jgi:hypothetical protein